MLFNHLVQVLQQMNWSFGKGDIASITINMEESRLTHGEWYGTVKRRFPGGIENDERMFKVSNRVVTFLSRRRKLPTY